MTEPSVWTDCDIGCVGDRLTGVISEGGEKQIGVSLLNTLAPSPAADEGRTDGEIAGNVIHLFFQKRWLSFTKRLFL